MCVFVSLTGLNNRSPKAQATCGHHGPANIKSLIISHYHFNGIPTTFCGWLMHLTTLIAHNSKIQKKNWMNSFRFQCPNSRPHLAVNLKSNFKRCSLEHGDGTYPQWQSQCSFPCVEHETNFHVPTFFCLGDGKAAYTAVAKRVPYIGIAFTPDHAPWLKKVSH